MGHFYKDVFAIQDFFGAATIGLVVATFVTNGMYNDEDKFFTKTENAHRKNFILMCCQAFIFFLLFIFKVVRSKLLSDNLKGRESEIASDDPVLAKYIPKHP